MIVFEIIIYGIPAIFIVGLAIYTLLSWITVWIRGGCRRNLYSIVTEDGTHKDVIFFMDDYISCFIYVLPIIALESSKPEVTPKVIEKLENPQHLTPEEIANICRKYP